MEKSKKLKNFNILLVILLLSMFIVIPIEKKNPNEIINTRQPQISSPYCEDLTDTAVGVYVSGDYAYVACSTSGLAVINVSDPTNPGTPVYEATTGNANGVYVSGDYAYIADGSSGLAVIDVSNPTNPGTPVYEATCGGCADVYVSGNYAYVADYNSGLAVVDISAWTGGTGGTGREIPFGYFFLIFMGLSVICLIVYKKRQIVREAR